MSIFRCSKCGCVENTALCNYWFGVEKLCSECDPDIGKWHDIFEKRSANGFLLGNDGFLYSTEDYNSGGLRWRQEHQGFKIIKEIKD